MKRREGADARQGHRSGRRYRELESGRGQFVDALCGGEVHRGGIFFRSVDASLKDELRRFALCKDI